MNRGAKKDNIYKITITTYKSNFEIEETLAHFMKTIRITVVILITGWFFDCGAFWDLCADCIVFFLMRAEQGLSKNKQIIYIHGDGVQEKISKPKSSIS